MRKHIAHLCVLLAPAFAVSTARAETVTILARQPATYAEASVLRKIVIADFDGNGGYAIAGALRQQFTTAGPDQQPYFTVVTTPRGNGIGILSGDVSLNSDQSSHVAQRTRCIESAGLFKCRRSETYNIRCYQRQDTAILNVRILRANDRAVVYAATKTYPQTHSWCEGSSPPQPVEANFAQAAPQIAAIVFNDVAPHTVSYRVRLLETTKGLSRTGSTAFKNAVRISTRDMIASCAQWNAIAAERTTSPALEFDLGVCAEQSGNLTEAEASYARALILLPGNRIIAEGSARVRTLTAARNAAAAQMAQRANAVASEQRQAVADERARRATETAAQNQTRRREAAAAAQSRRGAANARAAQAERRQSVTRQYGAGAADAILTGTVRPGMTKAQARAAVGGGCRIQVIGPGEEQWFCGSKRIVFSRGKVTFVR